MNDNKHLLPLINLLMAAWFMQGCIDELRGTNYNAHSLKMRLNQLEPELQARINTDLGKLWGADDKALYSLQDGLKETFQQMTTLKPEHIAAIGEMIKKLKQSPELFLHINGITIQNAA